jgi:hypothetical protein
MNRSNSSNSHSSNPINTSNSPLVAQPITPAPCPPSYLPLPPYTHNLQLSGQLPQS